jgi:hypothetical protein
MICNGRKVDKAEEGEEQGGKGEGEREEEDRHL